MRVGQIIYWKLLGQGPGGATGPLSTDAGRKPGGDQTLKNDHYDVAIVGGGPAGLQAALVLARTRKKIIVFDDPQPPRNSASHGVHNLLGLDGLPPAEIRALAWKQIAVYQSAELRPERVTGITRGDAKLFGVTGDQGSTVMAKQVILACGYRDVHPPVVGFAECWADTIIPCPYCDGYENRDRVWAVVAASAHEAHHFAKLAQNWTADVKVILQAGVSLEADFEAELRAAGISVHRGQIVQVHHTRGKVEAVSLENGERLQAGNLLWIPPKEPLPLIQALVDSLGLEVDDVGFVKTNEAQQTNVDRLWAAGDVQNGRWALDATCTGGKVAQTIIRSWYR